MQYHGSTKQNVAGQSAKKICSRFGRHLASSLCGVDAEMMMKKTLMQKPPPPLLLPFSTLDPQLGGADDNQDYGDRDADDVVRY
jgi:hypothetical protein